MRAGAHRIAKCFVLIMLLVLTGCTMSDFFWSTFGRYYTEGGPGDYDRQYHYEQKLDSLNRAAAHD